MNLLADYSGGLDNNYGVPTTEGELVCKWRQFLEITQEQLGAYCHPKMGKNGVYRIEKGASRLAIDTLLKVIDALERAAQETREGFKFGDHEAERLATFFEGPEGLTAVASVDGAVRAYLAARRRQRAPRR